MCGGFKEPRKLFPYDIKGVFEVLHYKSENLQYNTLGRWVDHFIDLASDGPSITLIG